MDGQRPDLSRLCSEGETIRKGDPFDHANCVKRRVLEYPDLVRARGRDIHPMEAGHHENAGSLWQASGSGDDLPRPGIKGEKLPRAHMRDVQAPSRGIKTLVIEP